MTSERIILAADELSLDQTLALVSAIGKRVYAFKIHNLYDLHGPGVVEKLLKAGAARVWVDFKFHDIPKTVKLRARALANSGASIITVHAAGGIEMMYAALESGIKVYAVTVLTSLDEEQTHLTFGQPSKAAVLNFARWAKLADVHGIVCSSKEVGVLNNRPELKGLEFITPGVRSFGKDAGDQKRVDTPVNAIKAGATRLVVGSQITQAFYPIEAFNQLEAELNAETTV